MTLLRSLFSRQRQSRHPAAITRREEAERARRASENKAAIERQAALAKAMTLRPLSTPMRPRDEGGGGHSAHTRSKKFPGARRHRNREDRTRVRRRMAGGNAGGTPTPAVLHDSNRAGEILLRRKITPMSGGSLQLRMFRNVRSPRWEVPDISPASDRGHLA
jgi:hypothetical protein